MRKLATVCVGFALAVFMCQYILPGPSWIYCAVGALILAALAAIILRANARLRALLALFGICAGFMLNIVFFQGIYAPAQSMDGLTETITVTATGYPESTKYGSRINVRCSTGRSSVKAVLYIYDSQGDISGVEPGDEITAEVLIELADTIGGEETDYYNARGIFLTLKARGEIEITCLDKMPAKYLPAAACRAVKDKLAEIYPEKYLGFMQAIITGDKDLINDDTALKSRLNIAGLSHVIAISGMHISFLVGFLGILIPNRRIFAFAAIPVLVFFAIMVGGTPSVIRACFMHIVVLMAPIMRRESDGITSLSLALSILLLINPFAARNVGLQLSFAATAGIMLLGGRIHRGLLNGKFAEALDKKLPRFLGIRRGTGKNPVVYFVCAGISTSIGALIFTCPISAMYFDYVSLIAPISNLLCLWAVTLIFVAGILSVLIGFIWLPAAIAVSAIARLLLLYVFAAVRVVARIPWAAVYTDNRFIVYWLVFLYASVAALIFVKEKPKRMFLPAGLIVCALIVALGFGKMTASRADINIAFLDVGQGACSVVTGGEGTVVIDCGGDYAAGSECAGYILSGGEHTVDYLILTHAHDDHANGVEELLATVRVKNVLMPPPVEEDNGKTDKIAEAAAENGAEVEFITQVTNLEAGNLNITVYPPVSDSNENESCLSCTVSDGDFDVLYTGDMSTSGEQSLYTSYMLPDVEVLAVGHHGSKYSTSEDFLRAVRPETAVISVGAGNSYGHPTEETLDRLEDAGAVIKRTDLHGRVIIRYNAQEE